MRRIRRRLEEALRSSRTKRAKPLQHNGLALSLEQLERRLLLNADLPGLHLVDPQVDYFDDQVVYLDFDGEENVTYNGPVTIDGISLPAFSVAPAELAGQAEAIIADVTENLNQMFGDSGVAFTAEKPDGDTPYSTVFIGGDDSAFSEYGLFSGVSEKIDVGNLDLTDSAFVFSAVLLSGNENPTFAASLLSEHVAHEVGHLLGYAHDEAEQSSEPLGDVAAESGYIVYADPDSFIGGQSKTVTVRVRNTGDSDDMIIEYDSKPSGWSISPSYRNPYMSSGSYYNATFTVTPPISGGSGTIVWEFRDDDVWSNDLLDTEYQSVSAAAVKPDLIVQDISISPSSPTAGQSTTITATLKNQGDADANGSIRLNYYVDGSYIGDDYLSYGLGAGSSNNESISYTASSSGNHAVKVIIDSNNIVSESNESNNDRTETYYWQPAPKPDLIVSDISISPSSPTAEQSATITATLKNQGNASASGSIRLNYYVDGSYIGDDYLSYGLGAGSSNNESISYTASSSGNHAVKVTVDSNNIVSESNENNNDRTETYYWQPAPKPDLIVTDIKMDGQTSLPSVTSGENVRLDFYGKNVGDKTSKTSIGMKWWWGTSQGAMTNEIDTGLLGTINGLAPGEQEEETDASWTIPALNAGTYWITAKIDWDNKQSDESNETNNIRSESFTVVKPDLIVSSITGTSSSYNVGDKVYATASIKNQGAGSAGESDLKYYLGTSSDKTYKYIEQGTVSSLSPGQTRDDQINFGYTIPSDVPEGTYYIWVQADSANEISESDESNNWGNSSSFHIHVPKPDLIVTDIKMDGQTSFPSVGSGENVRLDFYGKNIGDKTSKTSIGMKWWWGTSEGAMTNEIATGLLGQINGLSPGEEEEETDAAWTIPELNAGTYWITAKIDWDNKQNDESNETNNIRSESFTVVKPDLSVLSVTETAAEYQIGDKIDAKTTVQNIGLVDADGCEVHYYLGTDTAKTYKTITTGSLAGINGMQPNETESDWIGSFLPGGGWTIPNDVVTGNYYIWVHATTTSGDSNQNNDWNKSSPFAITGKVDSVSWSKSEVEAGEYVNVTISGVGLSGTIPLALYEDDDDGSPTDLGITISVPVSGTTGSTQWRADWIPDTGNFLGDIHPEFTLYYAEDDEWSGELHVKDTKSMESSNGLTVTRSGDNWAFNWDDTQDYGGDYGSGLDHYMLVVSNDPDFEVSFWDRLWTDDTLKKYDTGTESQYTVTDLDKDYYYWKVLAYDQAGNDPSMSANGPEFGSTVTNLWFENEHGDILDEDDILIVGQIATLKVETKGLANQTVTAQVYEDDLDWPLKDDPVGGPFSIQIGQNGIGEYEWLVPWVQDGIDVFGQPVLGNPEYFFRIDDYNKESISIDAEGTESEKGDFFMVVPWQIERGEDMPVVLGWHRPLLDWSDPNLDFATITMNGATVPLYSKTGSPLGSGSHSYEFSDINKSFYEIPNDPFWYTVGYVKASDWQSNVVDDNIEITSVFKYGLDGGAFSNSSSYGIEIIDSLPDWSDQGWYQGDTHWHSDITDSSYVVYGEYGTPLDIMEEIAPYLGLDWITLTDHSFDIDDSGAADTYRDIYDYRSMATLYDWYNLDNDPSTNFNDNFGFITGEEVSVAATGGVSPVEQYHVLTYGFDLNDDFIVGGRGIGIDAANGAIPYNTLASLINLVPGDEAIAILADVAISYALLGNEFRVDMDDIFDDIIDLTGIDNRSFSYIAHPLLEDDNEMKFGFAMPWTTEAVKEALEYEENNEKILRGFEFWNGHDDSERENSLNLWEELLVEQLAGNEIVDMNHRWYLSGGSDDHLSKYLMGESQPGDVQTVAWASSFNQGNILESFYNGTTIVTDGPLFAMGADPSAVNLDNYDSIAAKMGESLEATTIEECRLIFDWPDNNGQWSGNISNENINIYHYYDGIDLETIEPVQLDSTKVFDAFWDGFFNDGKTPGWHAFRAELVFGTETHAYTNPIWVNFDAVPDPSPIVEDITITILEGSTATDTVFATGGFGDKDFHIDSGPNFGELVFNNEDGSFTYAPYDENFNGADSFTYHATDEIPLDSNIGTVTIEIAPVNDAPSFIPGNDVPVIEDSGLYSGVWATNLSSGPTDDETSQILTFDVVNDNPSLFAEGFQPMIDSNGTLSFKTMENAFGEASLTVTLRDDGGTDDGGEDTSSSIPLTITVSPVNDPPEIPAPQVQPIAIMEDPVQACSGLVLIDDVDGDVLKYYADPTQNGKITMNLDGSFTYTPDENYFGTDSFTYWANDGEYDSEKGTIAFEIQSVNDLPVAIFDYGNYNTENSRIVIAENEPLIPDENEFTELDLLGTDIETPTEFLISEVFTHPQKGLLERFSGNRWRYTPVENENGYDSFAYFVTDQDDADSDPITVYLDIKPWNSKPVANSQEDVVLEEDGSITITLSGSDIETPADDLVYDIVAGLGPQNGILTKISNGKYRYEPDENFFGDERFEFTVTDDGDPAGSHSNPGDQTSLAATVSIEVISINDSPVAYDMDDVPADDTGEPAFITLAGTDVETPDQLAANIITDPTKGMLTFIEGREYKYVADVGQAGTDSFTFRLIDPEGAISESATVTIDIRPVNQTPIAQPQIVTVDEDENIIITLNATDMETTEGDLVFTPTMPTHGTLTPNSGSNNQFIYIPDPDYYGNDSFTFKATDNGDPAGSYGNNRPGTYDDPQTSDPVIVQITVNPIDDPSIPLPQSVVTEVDSQYSGQVMADDVDGDIITYYVEDDPKHGTVIMDTDGSFSYMPDDGYYGEDSFTFMAHDSEMAEEVSIIVGQQTIVYPKEKHSFYDAGGDFVTVVFTGPVGSTMEIIKPSDSGSDIARLVLNGTDLKSSLKVITKGKGSETTIGEIIVNGSLKSISAKTTDISKSIVFSGSISSITLDDILENVSVTTDAETSRGFALKADNLADDVVFDLAGLVKSFQVTTYVGGSLTADSIKTIKVKAGSLGANIQSDEGEIYAVYAYGDITGTIESASFIKSVTSKTGGLADGAIIKAQAGSIQSVTFSTDIDGEIRANGDIKSVSSKTGGLGANAVILANEGDIGTVKLTKDISGSIQAGNGIKSVSTKTGGLTLGAIIEAQNDIQSMKFNTDIEGEIHTNGNIKSISSKLGGLTEQGMILALEDIGTVKFNKGILSGVIRGRNIRTISALDLDGALLDCTLISAADSIGTVSVKRNVINSCVLAGYDIGMSSDRLDPSDDTLNPGDIKAFKFKGSFEASYVATGAMREGIYNSLYGLLPNGAEYSSGSGFGGKVSGPQPTSMGGFYSAGVINTKLQNMGDFVVMENL